MATIWESAPLDKYRAEDKAGMDEWQVSSATRTARDLARDDQPFYISDLAEPFGGFCHSEHYGALAARLVNAGLIVTTGRITEHHDSKGRARPRRLYRGTDKLKALEFTLAPPRASATAPPAAAPSDPPTDGG